MRPVEDHTKLDIDPAGLDILRRLTGPVAPVVVIGPYRSGKSFLLNQLLGVGCSASQPWNRTSQSFRYRTLQPSILPELKIVLTLVLKPPQMIATKFCALRFYSTLLHCNASVIERVARQLSLPNYVAVHNYCTKAHHKPRYTFEFTKFSIISVCPSAFERIPTGEVSLGG